MAQEEKALEFFNLGVNSHKARNYDEAIKHFTDCIAAMPPGPGSGYYNRALALLNKSKSKPQGLVNPIVGNVDKIMDLKVGGATQVKDELRVRALADVNKVLQMAPKHAAAYYLRADIYSAESMDEQAIADYRAGIAVDPTNEARKTKLTEMEKTAAIRIGMRAGALRMSALGLAEAGDKTKAVNFRKSLSNFLDGNACSSGAFGPPAYQLITYW